MALIAKQTLRNKNISFWKILLMIVITVIVMNGTLSLFAQYGPVFGSIAGLISLLICALVCGIIIYKDLAYYNYRIIDDEIFLERVIGRSNHIFFHINLKDVRFIKPYKEVSWDEKNIKKYKFVVNKDKDNWYVIEFFKEKKVYRIILEPDENFLNAMFENIKLGAK
ncbi:hypothetical protein SAMN02745883_02017 [Caminicella sporogenes DSM 14501]|uniref:Uncharacterized protein n=1 Tax=Caminicella sporogenes DSM 14501 TaxID=1121266 RepID=A0A1M6SDH2_9FIRM|nr:hypothetical protein [Caminicella sporogenes]RKD26623.1 hypothetical protein BET04_10050 [Caminicella sporogenes]SHK42699.1 hypothetical protein SAMN02745883_02017 [Caminicella sporogenes DSM 14501]